MKSTQKSCGRQAVKQPSKWAQHCAPALLLALIVALATPYGKAQVAGSGGAPPAQASPPSQVDNSSTVIISVSGTVPSMVNKTSGDGEPAGGTMESSHKHPGIQARAASSYLASRAASGLQLKLKPAPQKPIGAGKMLGDTATLWTDVDSQADLQTAAGEHKKYILVKKKPKHKKIKMEVYEPKMKYKKIKMKVPVKVLKKKKVKGYLVKKEKHGHW